MEDDHNRTVHGWRLGTLKGRDTILFLAALSMIIGLVILHGVFRTFNMQGRRILS